MRVQRSSRSAVLLAVLLCVGVAVPAAHAQTISRSGIEGKVTDQSAGVLPGVSVTITSQALLGGQDVTVTDGEGRYRFAALPSGVFGITFELAGFQTLKREGVRLESGFVATIDIRMSVGGVAETITVTGESPVVDVRTTAVATNFTRDALENLPTSRTMWQVLQMSPGMRITSASPDVGGNTVGSQQGYANYGSRGAGGNRPTVDGVDTREESSSAGFYYDYGAFEEVQIKAMGNDAEVSVSGTNFVGIIKSGSNKYHGSAFYAWETPKLQSNNVTDELKAQGITEGNPLKEYYDVNGDLGGRLLRDKLWFYVGGRRQRIKTGLIGYSRTAGADGVFGTSDDDPGEYKVTLTNTTAKLTSQITPQHRFNGFVQIQTKDYPEREGNAYRPAESTRGQLFKPRAGKIEWTYVPTNRSLLNVFVGRWYYDTGMDVYSHDPSTYDTVTLRYTGAYKTTTRSEPTQSYRGRWQYNVSFSHYKPDFLGGAHEFKVGSEVTTESRTSQAMSLEGKDYLLRFQSGKAYDIYLYSVPFDASNTMNMQSFYVKDVWRVGKRLTVNAGLRWERYHLYLPEQSREAGAFFPAADYERTELRDWRGLVPRVGVSYALTEDSKNVVKFTYGRFNWVLDAGVGETYNPNYLNTMRYRWSDANGNRDYDSGELGAYMSSTGGLSTIVNPNVDQPKVDELTASYERQIMADFSARVSYVYKTERNLTQFVNINRPYGAYSMPTTTTDPGADGIVGTNDDGGPVTYYDYPASYVGTYYEQTAEYNTDGNTSTFHNIEIGGQKRLSHRWQMVTSFLATHRDVWTDGVPQNPNAENFYPKDTYWEWAYKLSGSFQLPYAVQLAAMFTSQSGTPLAREVRFTTGLTQIGALTLRMEPLGEQKLPTQNLLNLRAEKKQRLGKYGNVSVQFDVFNTLNTNAATAKTMRSGTTYGRITAIVPPRIARVGVTYSF
jgi:hypothetical protein